MEIAAIGMKQNLHPSEFISVVIKDDSILRIELRMKECIRAPAYNEA